MITNTNLHTLVDQFTLHASEEDFQVLEQVLTGLIQKQEEGFHQYINAIINLKEETLGDTVEVRVPITPVLHNTMKLPHGGLLATIADAAMGRLAKNLFKAEGKGIVTGNLNINYLASAKGNELITTAHLIKKGRTVLVIECTICDDTGKEIVFATGTFHAVTPR